MINDLLIPSIKSEINFENFVKILNEIDDNDYYDSSSSFKGELIGIEIRLKDILNLNKNEEILSIFKLLNCDKEKNDF
jgi:hypothetical protein